MCVLCGNGLIVIPSHWLPLIRCRQKKPRTSRSSPHLFHPIDLGLHLDLGLGLCLCWSWSWMDCLQNTKNTNIDVGRRNLEQVVAVLIFVNLIIMALVFVCVLVLVLVLVLNQKIISSDPRHVGAVCRKWEPFYGTFFIQERQLEELEIVSCIRKQNRTNSNPMLLETKLNELKNRFFVFLCIWEFNSFKTFCTYLSKVLISTNYYEGIC